MIKKGYIYLIRNIEESHYKIGVGKDPAKRIKQLQTGNSSKLVLVERFETDIPYKIEKALHNRYSHLKKEGEWFNFSITEEQNWINECKRIEKNINLLMESGNVFV